MRNLFIFFAVFCCLNFTWSQSLFLDSSDIYWTAYKYTAKVGVSGTFDEIIVESSSGSTAEDLLKNLKFKIKTESVNSKNKLRDGRIYKSFFKQMREGDYIFGRIYRVANGEATIKITLNNISKALPLTYLIKGDSIELKTSLNLKSFRGRKAIASLNKVCKGLHAGKDGISLLWPTIDIKAVLKISQEE